jgi:hypothetical protein
MMLVTSCVVCPLIILQTDSYKEEMLSILAVVLHLLAYHSCAKM